MKHIRLKAQGGGVFGGLASLVQYKRKPTLSLNRKKKKKLYIYIYIYVGVCDLILVLKIFKNRILDSDLIIFAYISYGELLILFNSDGSN